MSRVSSASASVRATTASRIARMPGERGLDLAELDAIAAHLHLVVEPPQELERAVGRASGRGRRCGRAAPPASRRKPLPHEALGGQLRPMDVASREAVAGDPQLAGHADGHRPAVPIEHVHAVLAMGRPIGTERPGGGGAVTAWQQVNVVPSVGP